MAAARSRSRAFTLVEVLISTLILGFGLVVILQSYLAAANAVQAGQDLLTASRFARDKAVELEIRSCEKGGLAPAAEEGVFTSGGREFRWNAAVSVIDTPQYLSNDTVASLITLAWKERSIARSATLVSYFPRQKIKDENSTQ